MPTTAINVIILLSGFLLAVLAIGGDTWRKEEAHFLSRITARGWLSVFSLSVALGFGVLKEVRANEEQERLLNVIKDIQADAKGIQKDARRAREVLCELGKPCSPAAAPSGN